jgi:MFS-type transporter involved in bile tolerance (Atg22 family)
MQLSFVITLPLLVLLALVTRIGVIAGMLVLIGFTIQLSFGVVYSYVQEAVPAGISGTSLSLLSTSGIAGAFVAPLLAGVLIDITGTYLSVFVYASSLAALGIATVWKAPE